jgi:hypothetical protein
MDPTAAPSPAPAPTIDPNRAEPLAALAKRLEDLQAANDRLQLRIEELETEHDRRPSQ